MIYNINGEQPFQVLSESFSVSPSQSGYDLYFSADGKNYSKFATVESGVNRQFTGMNEGNYYILSGNTSEVKVNWMKDCSGGGGGGGTAGVSSLDGQTGALTTKTINGNAILGSGDIVISGGSGEEIIQNYQIVDDLSEVSGETETIIGAYSGVVIDYSTATLFSPFVIDSYGRDLYIYAQEGEDVFVVYDWDWNPVEDDGGEYRLREVDGRQLYQKLDKANKSLTILAVNPADVTYTVVDCSYVDTALTYSEEVTTYTEGQLAYVKGKKEVNEITVDWTKYQSVFESGEEISGLTLVQLCWSGMGEDWTLFSITQTGDTLSSDKGGNLEELICNDAWDNHKIEFEIYDENYQMVSLYVRYRAWNDGGSNGNQGWDNVRFSNDIYYSDTGEVYSGGSIYWVLGEDSKIEETGTDTISVITDFAFPTFYKWNGTEWKQAYIYLNSNDDGGLIGDYLAFGGSDVNEIKTRFVFNGDFDSQTKEPVRIENGKLCFRKDTLYHNTDNTIQIDVEYDKGDGGQPTCMTLTNNNYVIIENPDFIQNKNEGLIAYIPEKVEEGTISPEYFVQAHFPDPEDPWTADLKKLDIAKKKYLEVDGGNGLYDELVRLYTSGITDFSGYKFLADFSSVDSGISNTAISLELTKFDTDNDVIVFTGALCDGDSTGSVRTFRVELTSSGTLQNKAVGYIYSGPKSVVLTQAEYDALVQAGTVDPNTIYTII